MDLTLEALSVVTDGAALVQDLGLRVADGQVTGLVGPNGSGKSTALRCVYRALRPTSGTVRIGGEDLRDMKVQRSARTVAALTQDGTVDLDFTVEEVVALGRAPHLKGNQALGVRERQLCAEAMDRLGIRHLAHRGVLTLSGGERQRVLVARALVQEPKVLVLDEPTNHLDVRHQVGLLSLLRASGLTVLVVLHDLNLAAAACDRIGVLREGRLVTAGTPTEVLTADLVEEVFGVRADIVPHPRTGVPQLLYSLDSPDPAPPVPGSPELDSPSSSSSSSSSDSPSSELDSPEGNRSSCV